MIHKTDVTKPEDLAELCEKESATSGTSDPGKKKFIEPELSAPISVVETTKFFVTGDSGPFP